MSNAGNMLRLARQLRGLQQKEACEKLGVNTPELSRIENGVKEPSQDVISAAASVFGLPELFFGQADTVYGAPVSIHPAQWRKKADVTAGDLHRVVAELNVRVMHLRRLLEATDFEPLRNVPRCDLDAYDNDGERVAAIVRGHWQVPEGPIRNLTALVEEAGIVVAHSDFGGSSISGVTFRVPGVPPLVVLNTMHPSDRMRFTLSHEVAHIVMHRFPTPEMEEEADEFASCFLAPTTDIKPYFDGRRVDLRLLAALKPEWKMSMGSLVFAAKRIGTLNEGQATWIWKQFAMNNYRLREPPELDFPREQPRTLSDLVSLHMKELGYSLADLATALHMREDDVAKTYAIELPGEQSAKPGRLRVIK